MYFNELIKAKTKQAEILDEANRVHADAQKKLTVIEIQRKTLTEEIAANRDGFEVININSGETKIIEPHGSQPK
jgi:hypothetical protein